MKKRLLAVLCILAMVVSTMAGCTSKDNSLTENILDDNYRTFYEVFVYSFFDSDGDWRSKGFDTEIGLHL